MAKHVLDYNPLTGETVYFDYQQEDRVIISHEQDVSRIHEHAKVLAGNEDYSKAGIKHDQWHYARIPNIVLMEMKQKHNADWDDKNDTNHRHFFKVLNEHYREFKTTTLVHN